MHTSFLTTATQIQLANYITNTGCEWEFQWDNWYWSKPQPGEQVGLVRNFSIRIALTDLNLPSHLSPHNPANVSAEVITQGGYRAWTVMERENPSNRINDHVLIECWKDSKWDDTGWTGTLLYRTYRAPVSIPFPDWGEMSQPPAKGELEGAVKLTPDQEISKLRIWKSDMTTEYGKLEKWFQEAQREIKRLETRPTFAMPQPITDPMPPLAEGCKRYYTRWLDGTWDCMGAYQLNNDTHFLDLRNLPSPEDVNRTAFEKAWLRTESNLSEKETAWHFWNAALDSLNA